MTEVAIEHIWTLDNHMCRNSPTPADGVDTADGLLYEGVVASLDVCKELC